MEYMDYGNDIDVNSEDIDESLIYALLDDGISADEIDRRFGKNACRKCSIWSDLLVCFFRFLVIV